jgi:hypothetical protein
MMVGMVLVVLVVVLLLLLLAGAMESGSSGAAHDGAVVHARFPSLQRIGEELLGRGERRGVRLQRAVAAGARRHRSSAPLKLAGDGLGGRVRGLASRRAHPTARRPTVHAEVEEAAASSSVQK